MNEQNKIFNTLYGAIIGDALGVPVEFRDREWLTEHPVSTMSEYGTYGLPKGTWSDDSSMMLCLADSIGRLGKLNYKDIMKCFNSWLLYNKYTSDNKTFDCGRTCSNAIFRFNDGNEPLLCGGRGERDNGNGSLMRIAPLPLYLFSKFGPDAMTKEKCFERIHNVSSLTHAHPISLLGCDIYCSIMIEILKGTEKSDLKESALSEIEKYLNNHSGYNDAKLRYERIFQKSFKDIPENMIRSSGYVVDTLEAALWCFLNTENYKDCVLKAVNLGSDTDTVACVAGSIAGLYYGELPEEWVKEIRNRKLIDEILVKFSERVKI